LSHGSEASGYHSASGGQIGPRNPDEERNTLLAPQARCLLDDTGRISGRRPGPHRPAELDRRSRETCSSALASSEMAPFASISRRVGLHASGCVCSRSCRDSSASRLVSGELASPAGLTRLLRDVFSLDELEVHAACDCSVVLVFPIKDPPRICFRATAESCGPPPTLKPVSFDEYIAGKVRPNAISSRDGASARLPCFLVHDKGPPALRVPSRYNLLTLVTTRPTPTPWLSSWKSVRTATLTQRTCALCPRTSAWPKSGTDSPASFVFNRGSVRMLALSDPLPNHGLPCCHYW